MPNSEAFKYWAKNYKYYVHVVHSGTDKITYHVGASFGFVCPVLLLRYIGVSSRRFRFDRGIRHYHIRQRRDDLSTSGRRYFLFAGAFHAATVRELLRHYTIHPLRSRSPPATLDENDSPPLTELKLSRPISRR